MEMLLFIILQADTAIYQPSTANEKLMFWVIITLLSMVSGMGVYIVKLHQKVLDAFGANTSAFKENTAATDSLKDAFNNFPGAISDKIIIAIANATRPDKK